MMPGWRVLTSPLLWLSPRGPTPSCGKPYSYRACNVDLLLQHDATNGRDIFGLSLPWVSIIPRKGFSGNGSEQFSGPPRLACSKTRRVMVLSPHAARQPACAIGRTMAAMVAVEGHLGLILGLCNIYHRGTSARR